MASSPKNDFVVQNREHSIPYVENSVAFYMEPDDVYASRIAYKSKIQNIYV